MTTTVDENTPFEIKPIDIERFNTIMRENVEPFRAALLSNSQEHNDDQPREYDPPVFYIDDIGRKWSLGSNRLMLANGAYVFAHPHKIEPDIVRFVCILGLQNAWVDIPVSETDGYPHVNIRIFCANQDGTMEQCHSMRQLTRFNVIIPEECAFMECTITASEFMEYTKV